MDNCCCSLELRAAVLCAAPGTPQHSFAGFNEDTPRRPSTHQVSSSSLHLESFGECVVSVIAMHLSRSLRPDVSSPYAHVKLSTCSLATEEELGMCYAEAQLNHFHVNE